ncbi:hypothetical protein KEM55_006277 [Ascosphaera atra]|nr:hypothetical protein KEM55_006277 [Ascosphaera atra]
MSHHHRESFSSAEEGSLYQDSQQGDYIETGVTLNQDTTTGSANPNDGGRECVHRSGHVSHVPPPTQRSRRPQEHDNTNRDPDGLHRASPEVRSLLATADDETRALALQAYRDLPATSDPHAIDTMVTRMIRATTAPQCDHPRPEDIPLPHNPSISAPSSTGDQAVRRPRDLTPPPCYNGERRRAAARRWLRQCAEHFKLEHILTNISFSEVQKVGLASTWLDGTALHAWQSHADAHDANPEITIPQTWDEFRNWLLNRFDELNAASRLLAEFKRIRQSTDVQPYWNEFHIAYNLCGAKWDRATLMVHFIDSLKPDLQIEWKRAGHNPYDHPDAVLRELIRLEDVLNTQHRFDSRPPRARPGLNALPAPMTPSTRPPSRYQTRKWDAWCRDNDACYQCGAKGHRRADCRAPPPQTGSARTQSSQQRGNGRGRGRGSFPRRPNGPPRLNATSQEDTGN